VISFFQNRSSKDDIISHFNKCDKAFVEHLESRVDLNDYAQKIFEKAQRFEMWDQDNLIGLVASYHNQDAQKFDFITSVSVVSTHARQGIASYLLEKSIDYARAHNALGLKLEVSEENIPALSLYHKYGFVCDKNDIKFYTLSFHDKGMT
jgi:ribosomal protein S18 acetylase RimI-like enzyme